MRSRRARVTAAVVAGSTVVAACIVAAVLTGTPHPASTTAASTPGATPRPVASASPLPAATVTSSRLTTTSASTVVGTYVAAVDRLTPTSTTAALASVVSGKAMDEIQAQQLEFQSNGWSVTGKAEVSAVTVLHTATHGTVKTAEVQACIDSSHVRLVTAKGEPVFPPSSASRRALNLYDLQYVSGGWRIVRHTFPTDPTC